MSCHFRHSLSYRGGWKPKEDGIPLQLGSMIHAGIAAEILHQSPEEAIQALVRENQEKALSEEWAEMIYLTGEQALDITNRAIDWLEIREGRWETIELEGQPLVELALEMPLWDLRASYKGVIDWVARDTETGKIHLIDFKTRGRFNRPDAEETNLQLMSYMFMLTHYGVNVDTASIIQILTKLPSQPKLNKDGSMSRQKITTDWSTYRAALVDAGLDPADYEDMREKLDGEFFDLIPLYFSHEEVFAAWHEIIRPAIRSILVESNMWLRSMSTWNCKYCAYREPCLASLRGHDMEGLLDMYFDRREGYGSETYTGTGIGIED